MQTPPALNAQTTAPLPVLKPLRVREEYILGSGSLQAQHKLGGMPYDAPGFFELLQGHGLTDLTGRKQLPMGSRASFHLGPT